MSSLRGVPAIEQKIRRPLSSVEGRTWSRNCSFRLTLTSCFAHAAGSQQQHVGVEAGRIPLRSEKSDHAEQELLLL